MIDDPLTPPNGTARIEVHGPISDRTRRRGYTRDILLGLVVLTSLALSFYVVINKSSADNENAHLIAVNTARNLCAGRYQDAVDAAETDRSSAIGELIVTITQIPPGTDREQAVTATVAEVAVANKTGKAAVAAKAAYNTAGRPLPCPIDQENP